MITLSEFSTTQKDPTREIVTVFLKKNDRPQPRALRCIYCGKLVCGITKDAKLIVEGAVEEMNHYQEKLCQRCNVMYRIE